MFKNHTCLNECGGASSSSCLVVEDVSKLDMGFHPRDLKCSHYYPVYKKYSDDDIGYELGTRVLFDIPDHVPDICTECQKPNGNCGVGLRCICHLQECKDKVVSKGGGFIDPVGNILVSLISFVVVIVSAVEI
ncbi:hypothetical protein FNV43_RR05792 [Rhamnella rubrinervis]|uniref:Uncharacterized protein n=1 Tax=Rhamnella rubrinervis TaxID=2594499 RepID=A0A8K0MRG3_9ROSA|nr:hypothetical protein FNV43_RR05792 [Rhamnella rubrinervis]